MPIVCHAYHHPIFQPAMRIILSITNANPAVVTTSYDGLVHGAHYYHNGTIVRLDIPVADGMQEANQFFGPISVIDQYSFSIPLDTTHFTPFSIPNVSDPHIVVCAQVVPIGESNDTLKAATRNVLPGRGF